MLLSQSICSILLALGFLFSNAQGEKDEKIIGFRTVSKEEADYINEYGKPYRDPKFDLLAPLFNVFGLGFNIVNVPAGWPGADDEWYCAIQANEKKFDAVSKIWIPEKYQRIIEIRNTKMISLWAGSENDIRTFIRSRALNQEKALRFFPAISYDKDMADTLQMVIPTETVNSDELELSAQCWETKEELEKHWKATVDYESWDIVNKPKM